MSEVQSSAAPTVVLVHGGFVDGAGWEGVYKLLRKDGYNVSIVQNPTLTLADDVAATRLVIAQAKGLVVLVGHSYGGFVARHVADRMPDRIRSLIYLDAFVPENGKTLFDYLPDNGEGDRNLAVAHGDGWRVPPRPASFFAVNAADASWVDSQCTMHPLSSFEAPAQISGACDDIANIGYIRASGFDSPFGQFYAKAGERRWWREELACGHDVMLDMPNELAALLQQRT